MHAGGHADVTKTLRVTSGEGWCLVVVVLFWTVPVAMSMIMAMCSLYAMAMPKAKPKLSLSYAIDIVIA